MEKINKKGFTLIELLAVITILGVIMILALPAISLILEDARHDTIFTTIDAYIESVKYDVVDGTYDFEDSDETIYAVPIECVDMDNGGKYPYGQWLQANNDYWAYVLVQYDSENQQYTYGFTYKDSVGWGLYPTEEDHLLDQQTVISKGLKLYKPITGTFGNIAGSKDWAGFDLESDTKLVVLEATTEGEIGNGKTTCTLVTKGSNYEEVEAEKRDRYAAGKPCRLSSTTPGSLMTCGTEKFYLLKDDEATMTFLAQYQIDVTTVNPKQNINAEGTYFADTRYWMASATSNKPSIQFGGKYPTYVYGNYSGNNIYQYVKAYENYLETTLNIRSASLTIMSMPQTVELLKCSYGTGSSTDCSASPYRSWINQGYRWFTGTLKDAYNIGVLESTNSKFQWGVPTPYPFPYGIRPMLIIDKNDIDFIA